MANQNSPETGIRVYLHPQNPERMAIVTIPIIPPIIYRFAGSRNWFVASQRQCVVRSEEGLVLSGEETRLTS